MWRTFIRRVNVGWNPIRLLLNEQEVTTKDIQTWEIKKQNDIRRNGQSTCEEISKEGRKEKRIRKKYNFDEWHPVMFYKYQMNKNIIKDHYKFIINYNGSRQVVCNIKYKNKANRFNYNYHTTNKCTNCMSFIFKSLFKTLSLLLHVSIAYRLSSSGSTYSS